MVVGFSLLLVDSASLVVPADLELDKCAVEGNTVRLDTS